MSWRTVNDQASEAAAGEPTAPLTVTVNGAKVSRQVRVRTLLSDFLRHTLSLTGTHVACEQGVCGACTVIVDGQAVRSCLMLAVQADGLEVDTVESLAVGDQLSGFQQAMKEHHGLQCGFCTPGILMSMAAAQRNEETLEAAEEHVLNGHVCRCTGYMGIRAAIRQSWNEGNR